MAKRKLSGDQRAELRASLKKAMATGQKTPDVLRENAKKYGISTITVRWYLKSVNGKLRNARKGSRLARKLGRPTGSNSSNLVKLVDDQVSSAREARRLLPRWQRLVSRELTLKNLASKLERKLAATSRKASRLRKLLDALIKR
jgi:hypothetical protein